MLNNIWVLIISNAMTWFFTYLYYQKSKKEVSKLLTNEVKSIILSKPEEVNWQAKEIVKLYQKKYLTKRQKINSV